MGVRYGSLILSLLVLLAAGCGEGGIKEKLEGPEQRVERLEKELVDTRSQRTDAMDALFAESGGGEIADEVNQAADAEKPESPDGKAMLQLFKNAVSEMDRSAFEAQVEIVGGGERPVLVSTKAQEFFARPDVKARCKTIAELGRKAARIEQELQPPPPPAVDGG